MILEQFFSQNNIEKFISNTNLSPKIEVSKLRNLTTLVDYDLAFSQLLQTVSSSPLGGMLSMFGGETVLEPLKDPFKEKMKTVIIESLEKETTQDKQKCFLAQLVQLKLGIKLSLLLNNDYLN